MVAFSKMQGSVRAATSTTAEAHGLMQGQQSTLTLSGDLDGDPTKAHAAMGKNGTADILAIGQTMYVKGDASYWKAAAEANTQMAQRLSGKWFKTTKGSFGSDAGAFSPKSLTAEVTDDNGTVATKFQSSSATITKTTDQNRPAYLLTGDDGKTKVWCSADGRYTLFKVEQPDNPDDFTSATFSGWNTKTTIGPPAGAITLPDHKGGSGGSGGSDGGDSGTTT